MVVTTDTRPMPDVDGEIQREGEVVHVVARRLHDLTPLLAAWGGATTPSRCRTGGATKPAPMGLGLARVTGRRGA